MSSSEPNGFYLKEPNSQADINCSYQINIINWEPIGKRYFEWIVGELEKVYGASYISGIYFYKEYFE